ncbi:hypothetical protein DPMN_170379 [Dreissena polymorpha]|uniref:Uncharacterized protein n=1 Tax=Dreissena polymorpha TaxID=45954 RepID=A0A9D4IBH0_DREPO|nr:hypothetical protein DPMN_170379 [Dreissena polymorpha]
MRIYESNVTTFLPMVTLVLVSNDSPGTGVYSDTSCAASVIREQNGKGVTLIVL